MSDFFNDIISIFILINARQIYFLRDDWLIFYEFFKRAPVRGWRPPLVTFSENDQCRLNSSCDSAISILPNSIN